MDEKYYLLIHCEYNGFSAEEFNTSGEVTEYIQNDEYLKRFLVVEDPSKLVDVDTYCIIKGRTCKVKKTVEVL